MAMRCVAFFICLFLWHCSSNDNKNQTDYKRTVFNFHFTRYASEKNVYVLSWENPADTTGYIGSLIYLDTTNWETIRKDTTKARSYFLHRYISSTEGRKKNDSILISLADDGNAVEKMEDIAGLAHYKLDTNGRLDTSGFDNKRVFRFAIIPQYRDGEHGENKFTFLPVFDVYSPDPVRYELEVGEDSIAITWDRPHDLVSFFEPNITNGVIREYAFHIGDGDEGFNNPNFKKLTLETLDSIVYINHQQHYASSPKDSTFKSWLFKQSDSGKKASHEFKFPDGVGFSQTPDSNQVKLILYGLIPEQDYKLSLYAIDTSGNKGGSDNDQEKFKCTDTTQPIFMKIRSDTTTKNLIRLSWPAGRDSRAQDKTPHANIAAYIIEKTQTSDIQRGFPADTSFLRFVPGASFDTLVQAQTFLSYSKDTALGRIRADFYFLSPNTEHHFKVYAIDSSGHRSPVDSMIDTTSMSSAIICPQGYVPITRDSTKFCIQTMEYQNTDGAFETSIDAESASELCSKKGTSLCTTDEWKDACLGDSEPSQHLYGIAAIPKDPKLKAISMDSTIVQSKCNHGAGDARMASTPSLRPLICSTNEGVRDMTGQYSEWVRLDSITFVVKGGNYLKNGLPVTKSLSKALCTHQTVPLQSRPEYTASCIWEDTSMHKIVLRYRKNTGKDSLVCKDKSTSIDSIWVNRDSTVISYKTNGVHTSVDTMILRKDKIDKTPLPRSIERSTNVFLQIAVVRKSAIITPFQLSDLKSDDYFLDTLDYRTFRNFPTPALEMGTISNHQLLTREANPKYWSVVPLKTLSGAVIRQADGNEHVGKPIKPFYSHPAIGFRCCDRPD